MLHATSTASAKRAAFRARLAEGGLVRMPGAFNPLSAKLIEDKGFEGVYISGAVLSADLGLPDIGLTTLTEVAQRGGHLTVHDPQEQARSLMERSGFIARLAEQGPPTAPGSGQEPLSGAA